MKKLIAAASVLAIAACSQPAPEEEAVEEVVEEAAPAVGGPGTYEVTYADGSVGMLTTSEDGTFSVTLGDQTGSGTVSEADGKVCFDPDGDDPEQPTTCWTPSAPAEDGSWTSTSDDGETVTVRPVEAAAEE
ncbi:MAG: hypothetical protein EP341_09480 [Sphingomonadales bacterium]|nr:MAG: hypothetical protein EP341_09480 [Sphingomonadales bacterium]